MAKLLIKAEVSCNTKPAYCVTYRSTLTFPGILWHCTLIYGTPMTLYNYLVMSVVSYPTRCEPKLLNSPRSVALATLYRAEREKNLSRTADIYQSTWRYISKVFNLYRCLMRTSESLRQVQFWRPRKERRKAEGKNGTNNKHQILWEQAALCCEIWRLHASDLKQT